MNTNGDKLVAYEIWCKQCKYFENPDAEEPCAECLDHPTNQYSTKPINWRDKNGDKKTL